MRADATRNHDKILRAARAVVVRHGAQAGMDEIAAEAGVAVGTLYRHFPTKEALLRAVMASFADSVVARLEEAAARVAAGAPAFEALAGLLAEAATEDSGDWVLRAALADIGVTPDAHLFGRALDLLGDLVAAAHDQGGLRPDITVEDLVTVMKVLPVDADPAVARRILRLVVRGMATGPG